MEWILIISMYLQTGKTVEIESIEFNDKQACENGARIWQKDFQSQNSVVQYPAAFSIVCVPKGSGAGKSTTDNSKK